jgi:formate hydrogenlyase transcriptional activator
VRLIAATHHNLSQMMGEGKFRADLFYRLNVFPIRVPALRERRDDIPLLVRHFVGVFAQKMSKSVEVIPGEVIEGFAQYDWPGNIRELENFVERCVILSQGSVLEAPLHELTLHSERIALAPVTLKDAERAHIAKTLRECGGVIGAAAVRLGIPRSTLFYKMRRLGITAGRGTGGRPRALQLLGAADA